MCHGIVLNARTAEDLICCLFLSGTINVSERKEETYTFYEARKDVANISNVYLPRV